jgi:hypothetical protein
MREWVGVGMGDRFWGRESLAAQGFTLTETQI